MSQTCLHSSHNIISHSGGPLSTNMNAQAAFHVPVDQADSMTRLDPVPVSSTGFYRWKGGGGVDRLNFGQS